MRKVEKSKNGLYVELVCRLTEPMRTLSIVTLRQAGWKCRGGNGAFSRSLHAGRIPTESLSTTKHMKSAEQDFRVFGVFRGQKAVGYIGMFLMM